jgi:hypothetical protein
MPTGLLRTTCGPVRAQPIRGEPAHPPIRPADVRLGAGLVQRTTLRRNGDLMSLPDLAAVLWRQRELIERLCYRLECEQLLLANGRTSRLPLAVAEVETAVENMQVLEIQRAEAADRAAAELGLPAGSGLTDLAAAAQPPWTEVFLEHRAALLSLTMELRSLAETNQALVNGGLSALQTAIESLGSIAAGPAPVGYDATGRHRGVAGTTPLVFDRKI